MKSHFHRVGLERWQLQNEVFGRSVLTRYGKSPISWLDHSVLLSSL